MGSEDPFREFLDSAGLAVSNMPGILFIGCILTALSVPFALMIFVVGRRAQLIIITICSMFFYVLALSINSIIWTLLSIFQKSPALFIPVAVAVIEIARYYFFKFFAQFERSFSSMETNEVVFPLTDLTSSLAGGLGFALGHITLIYIPTISKSLGPGTYFTDECPDYSVYVISSILALGWGLQHIFLMVIAFDIFRKGKKVFKNFGPYVFHFVASAIQLLTRSRWCLLTACLEVLLGFFFMFLTWRIVHGAEYRQKLRQY